MRKKKVEHMYYLLKGTIRLCHVRAFPLSSM
jgi:hypothetical protein